MMSSDDPLAPPRLEEGNGDGIEQIEQARGDEKTSNADNGRILLWLAALVAFVGAAIIVVVIVVFGDDDDNSPEPLNTTQILTDFPPVPDVNDPQDQLDMILQAVEAEPLTAQLLGVLPSTVSELETEANKGSTDPHIRAASWVVLDDNYNKENQIVERFALAAIYYSTQGDSWIESENWFTDSSFCDAWYGITCCSHYALGSSVACNGKHPDHISALELVENNLQGDFPLAVALLKDLFILRLPWNSLEGTLDGSIIASLPDLHSLFIQHNRLTGPFDPDVVANGVLKTLYVQGNLFTGSWPDEYCQLEKWHYDCFRNGCPCGRACSITVENQECTDLSHLYGNDEDP